MRVFHFNNNGDGDNIGLRMRIENEGHRMDNSAPNPDCIIANKTKSSNTSTPTFGGGDWAYNISHNAEYATTVLKTLGIKNGNIKDGVDMTVEGWFNGKDFLGVNYSITDYPLMHKDKGPITSGMGSVVFIGKTTDKLFESTIGKLQVALEKIGYKGVLSFKICIGENGFKVNHINAGLDWNTLPVLFEMLNDKTNDLIYGIACGINKEMRYKSSLGMGIVLATLPYPSAIQLGHSSVEIKGLNKHNLKHFWMDDPEAKTTGRLGVVTARGDEVQGFSALRDARRRVMRTINNLTIKEVMFRDDVGNRVEQIRAQLKLWKWL